MSGAIGQQTRPAATGSGVMPEIGVTAALSAGTVAAAIFARAGAVALAPVFAVGKLHRMDVPCARRVVE